MITGLVGAAEGARGELSLITTVLTIPPMTFIPAEWHGKPVVMILKSGVRTSSPCPNSAVRARARRLDPNTTMGGTAMLEGVFYTSVLVSDQDKAIDFYTNVLGLEKRIENPTRDGPRFRTVGVKGDNFQLVLWPGTPGEARPAMGRPPASITIESDDCRNTVEELKSRGVEFVSDVLEFHWGYVAQFQDPDGNWLQIREGR